MLLKITVLLNWKSSNCTFALHAFPTCFSIHSYVSLSIQNERGLTSADVNSRYFTTAPCCLVACIPILSSSLLRVSAQIWLHASFAPVCISIKAGCEALHSSIVHVLWHGLHAHMRWSTAKPHSCSFTKLRESSTGLIRMNIKRIIKIKTPFQKIGGFKMSKR